MATWRMLFDGLGRPARYRAGRRSFANYFGGLGP